MLELFSSFNPFFPPPPPLARFAAVCFLDSRCLNNRVCLHSALWTLKCWGFKTKMFGFIIWKCQICGMTSGLCVVRHPPFIGKEKDFLPNVNGIKALFLSCRLLDLTTGEVATFFRCQFAFTEQFCQRNWASWMASSLPGLRWRCIRNYHRSRRDKGWGNRISASNLKHSLKEASMV